MDEKPLPTIDASQESMLEEFQKELWINAAVIHDRTFKVVEGGMVAVIQHSPGLKGLACKFDGPVEEVDVQNVEDLRDKLYLVFKKENPGFLVYGGKKASRINDGTVEAAFEQIESENQFLDFSKEMEKIMEQEGDKNKPSH